MNPYPTPGALEAAIVQRLRNTFGSAELGRRRSEVAYRRLVARLAATAPDRWVIKGGYGLILRLDPNRTSNDVDVVYLDAGGEHAVAIAALEAACRADLGDFFAFAIVSIGDEEDGRTRTATVVARLGAQEWSRFGVDIAFPRADVPAHPLVDPPRLTGLAVIDDIPRGVGLLAWEQQIAEKCCGLFERRGETPSGRLRDLLDLAMIARQVSGLDGGALIDALGAEAARRPLLPDGLPAAATLHPDQRRSWAAASRRATRSAPISLDDAERIVRRFLDPVLAHDVGGKAWSAESASWVAPGEGHTAPPSSDDS